MRAAGLCIKPVAVTVGDPKITPKKYISNSEDLGSALQEPVAAQIIPPAQKNSRIKADNIKTTTQGMRFSVWEFKGSEPNCPRRRNF